MMLLEQKELCERLESSSPRVQMWAAYHLSESWADSAEDFVAQLIDSPTPEIKESGVFLVGEKKLQAFAFPLLRIFNASEGSLRRTASIALAQLKYSELNVPLWTWFEALLESEEHYANDLVCAIQSLLLLDKEGFWPKIEKALVSKQGNHLKALPLFSELVFHLYEEEQLSLLLEHYSTFRDIFADPHFFDVFIDVFQAKEALETVRARKSYGYSIKQIYQECLNVLGWDIPQKAIPDLESLDSLIANQKISEFVERLSGFTKKVTGRPIDGYIQYFLLGFQRVSHHWGKTTLKIQDQELFFLVALPLLEFLSQAEDACYEHPLENADRIARVYHSPLLRKPLMYFILNTLYASSSHATPERKTGSDTQDSPKDALWKLANRQIDLMEYDLPQILPNPWQYEPVWIVQELVQLYQEQFETMITLLHHSHLDYGLQLFRRQPSDEIVQLLVKHFSVLINQHFHWMFEFIEYVPDLKFLEPLLKHHREGEGEIQQLIEFLCNVHQVSNPLKVEDEVDSGSLGTSIRILCPKCHTSYHYRVNTLYFDQELIEQRRPFSNMDLWTNDTLNCKNCEASLQLKAEKKYLASLYAELLTMQLLQLSEEEKQVLEVFRPLTFPRYFGKKTNPSIFLKRVTADLKDGALSEEEQIQLLMELGKFYGAIDSPKEAKQALLQVLKAQSKNPLALFQLGLIAFREKNLYDARTYFSRIVNLYSKDSSNKEGQNFVELAKHYLEILDQREFKRTTLQLIRS